MQPGQDLGFTDRLRSPEPGAVPTSYAENFCQRLLGPVELPHYNRAAAGYPLVAEIQGSYGDEWGDVEMPERKGQGLARNEAVAAYVLPLFRGAHVLDLGCGVQGCGYRVADAAGAASYTGIELYFAKTAAHNLDAAKGALPYVLEQVDLMAHLERAVGEGRKAGVILALGVDEIIVPSYKWPHLTELAEAVLAKGGALLVGGGIGPNWQALEQTFTRDSVFDRIIQAEMAEKRLSVFLDPGFTIMRRK